MGLAGIASKLISVGLLGIYGYPIFVGSTSAAHLGTLSYVSNYSLSMGKYSC